MKKCKQGHNRTPENTNGRGECKVCCKERQAKIRARRKAEFVGPIDALRCRNGHRRTPENTLNSGACRECSRITQKAWAVANPEKVKTISQRHLDKEDVKMQRKERSRAWQVINAENLRKKRRANPEPGRKATAKWRHNNPDAAQMWKAANKDKCRASVRKRQASKSQRTPPWLSSDQDAEIGQIYAEARRLELEEGVKYHVDHIVPLQGENVSGLHVPWNLQVLRAQDNLSKGNGWSPQ